MSQNPTSKTPPDSAESADPPVKTPIAIGGWKTVILLTVANISMYAIFQGMQQILLPTQVAQIDPEGKIAGFGILSSIGALMAAIANPLTGRWSDITRTRWGKRAPWLICTAILSGLALLLLAGMNKIFTLGAAYLVVMTVMGAFQAVVGAVLPDRVSPKRMGTASSIVGMATSLGVLIGVNSAARLAGNMWAGYGVLAALLIVTTLVFVLFCPDPSRPGGPGIVEKIATDSEPGAKRGFFSALRDHDYRWAFLACIFVMLGYWTTATYILYTLIDYIGKDNIPGTNPQVANATLTTITMVCMFATTVISGPISDKLGRRKIFVIISSLGVAGAAMIPVFLPTWNGMVFYIALSGLFFGCYMAVDRAIMALVLPSSADNGRDLGLTTVATTGPQVAGPLLAAVIISNLGGYAPLYIFAAIMSIIGAVCIIPIKKIR
jgi:MFS family permease